MGVLYCFGEVVLERPSLRPGGCSPANSPVPGPPEHKDRGDKAEEAAQEVAGDDGWLPSSKQECLSCQESEELRAQCDRLDQVRPQQDHQEPQQLLASQQEPPGVGGRDFSSQQYDLNRDSQEDEDASSC